MANNIEQRIVDMQFNNAQFEAGAKETMGTLDKLDQKLQFKNTKGLDGIQKSLNNVDISHLSSAMNTISNRFSAVGIAGATVIQDLTRKAEAAVGKVVNGVTNVYSKIKSGGSSRALNLEQARFMLKGLTGDMEKVEKIISGPVNDAVSGTRFGLDAAAVAASNLYASGVTGSKELTKSLQAISGAATMTNREYGDMADIFATIKSNGKLMTMQLRQFSAMGMNVSAELATALGKSEQEINEMVTAGQISYEQFVDVMYKYWDLAADANTTYSGSLANVNAQLSKIGEVVATKYYSSMIKVNVALINLLKAVKVELEPLYKIINNAIGSVTDKLADFISNEKTLNSIKNIIAAVTNVAKGLKNILSGVGEAFDRAFPGSAIDKIEKITSKIEKATKQFKKFYSLGDGGKTLKQVKAREKESKLLHDIIGRYEEEKKVVKDSLKIKSKNLGYSKNEIKEIKRKTKAYEKSNAEYEKTVKKQEKVSKSLNKIIKKYDLTKPVLGDHIKLSKEDAKYIEKKLKLGKDEVNQIVDRTKAYDEGLKKSQEELEMRRKTSTQLHDILKRYKAEKTTVYDKIKLEEKDHQHVKNAFGTRAKTIKQLKDYTDEYDSLTKAMKKHGNELIYQETNVGKVQQIFDGFFSVINVGKEIFRGFLTAISPITDRLGALGEALLDIASTVGSKLFDFNMDFLDSGTIADGAEKIAKALDEFLPTSDKIKEWGEEVSKYLEDALPSFDEVANKIKEVTDAIKDFFESNFDTTEISKAFEDLGSFEGIMSRVERGLEIMKNVFGNVFKFIFNVVKDFGGTVLEMLGSAWDGLADVAGEFVETLKRFMKEADFSDVADAMNVGFLALVAEEIYALFTKINKLITDTNIPASLNTLIIDLKNGFNQLKAAGIVMADVKILESVAKAVLMIAAALFLLCLVDSDKLTVALGVVTTLIIELCYAMKMLNTSVFKPGLQGNFMILGASMALMAASVLILAGALAILGNMDYETLGKGLGAISALMIVLIKSLEQMSEIASGKKVLAAAGAMLLIANSILVLSAAIVVLSLIPVDNLIKALGALGVSLYFLIQTLQDLSGLDAKGMLAGAGAMFILAAAMIPLTIALAALAAIPLPQLAKSMIAMALGLAFMADVLKDLSKAGPGMIIAAGAILIMANALVIMSAALAVFSAIPFDKMMGGLVGMAATMLIVVAALQTLSTVGPAVLVAAAAILAVSVALNLFAVALIALSAVPFTALLGGVVALTATLVAVGVVLGALATIGPALLVVGGAIALVGAGILGIGAGLTLLVTALTALGGVIGVLAVQISKNLGVIVEAIVGMITKVLSEVIKMAPKLLKIVLDTLLKVIKTITSKIAPIAAAATKMVVAFLEAITKNVGKIVKAATTLIVKFANALTKNVGKIVTAAVKLVTAFINGIADNIGKIIKAAFNLVVKFIEGLADAIDQNGDKLRAAVKKLIKAIVGFIKDGISEMVQAGKDLIAGFKKGIEEKWGEIKSKLISLADKLPKWVKKKLGIASPSKVFYEIGVYCVEGFVNGITAKTPAAVKAMGEFADTMRSTLETMGLFTSSDLEAGRLFNTKNLEEANKKIKESNERIKRLKKDNKEIDAWISKQIGKQKSKLTLTKSERIEVEYLQKKLKQNGTLTDKEYKRLMNLLGVTRKQEQAINTLLKQRKVVNKELAKETKELETQKEIIDQITSSMANGSMFGFGSDNILSTAKDAVIALANSLYESTDAYIENTKQKKANDAVSASLTESSKELTAQQSKEQAAYYNSYNAVHKYFNKAGEVIKQRKKDAKSIDEIIEREKKASKTKGHKFKLSEKEAKLIKDTLGIKAKDLKSIEDANKAYKDQTSKIEKINKRREETGKISKENALILAEGIGLSKKTIEHLSADIKLRDKNKEALDSTTAALKENKETVNELNAANEELDATIQNDTINALVELRKTVLDNIKNALDPLKTSLSETLDLFNKFSTTDVSWELPVTVEELSADDLKKAEEKAEKIKKLTEMGFSDTVVDKLKDANDATIDKYLSMSTEDIEKTNHAITNQLIQNIKSYSDTREEFEKTMTDLQSKGFNEMLLERIKKLGPAGLKLAKAYMQMNEEEVKQANAAILKSTETTVDEWLDSVEEKAKKQQKYLDDLNRLMARGLSSDAYNELLKSGYEAGGAYVEGLLNGPQKNITRLNTAYDKLADSDLLADKAIVGAAAAGQSAGNALRDAIVESVSQGLMDDDTYKQMTESLTSFVAIVNETIKQQNEDEATKDDSAGKQAGELYINGMVAKFDEDGHLVVDAASTVAKEASNGIDQYLSKANGKEVGKAMDSGMVEGLKKNGGKVEKAAKNVAKAAYTAAISYLQVHSPSKKFEEIGKYSDLGFAKGLETYASKVQTASESVAITSVDAMREALDRVNELIENNAEPPVIRPVLDLSNIERGTVRMKRLLESASVTASTNASGTSGDSTVGGDTNYQFIQNNYSPKALSRIDIYRQTRNQFSMLKGR